MVEVDRIGSPGAAGRAPVGAPPASRGGLTAPLALPTGAAESPRGDGMMRERCKIEFTNISFKGKNSG